MASSMLSSALGQDFGIYESKGFKLSPDFYLQSVAPSGEYFNFCDCDGRINGAGALLLGWFAAKTGDGKYFIKEFFENPVKLGRFAGPGLVWLSAYENQKNSELATVWFGKGRNPVAIFRNRDNINQYYLAAKGGAASVIHGNMDAGTFVFELNGVRWVVDPGNQSYYPLNKIGFDLSGRCQECERWTLLTKSNKGHSTITINNERHIAEVEMTEKGAILKQDGKRLNLEIISPDNLRISVISMDPPPLGIDKTIKNLKRIEIRVPAWTVKNHQCIIKVRMFE